MTVLREDCAIGAPPDPGRAGSLDEIIEALRALKVWAGDPSYDTIRHRINAVWRPAGRPADEMAKRATIADCFKIGRRRVNTDLVLAVVRALHPDAGYCTQWRQALRVVGGVERAAAQVRVQDYLPSELPGFTGRTAARSRLGYALGRACGTGGAVAAITGMPGVGKTQLAVHIGHSLHRDARFDHVLFVDLRGFHPDPAQPPANPAAVLDGFLRLLGVPGQEVPYEASARVAAYRRRLAGGRVLVILDNAADEHQVRPLLAESAGSVTLITSRRGFAVPDTWIHVDMDVFTPEESLAYLGRAAAGVPVGRDPDAPARIARRCGQLPLALALVAGHLRNAGGWTLTDHADRLDERHRDRRLDTVLDLAFGVSYQHLCPDEQRVLRRVAAHPGHDFDVLAAAAMDRATVPVTSALLRRLRRDHLLERSGSDDRYTMHDLVRVYALGRGVDEDPPAERRAALTRLFDQYLANTAAAMHLLYPTEIFRRRPAAERPAVAVTDHQAARDWLDGERHTLVAVVAHTAEHGWPTHAIRLAATLFRYLNAGHHHDALIVHGHAVRAAGETRDPMARADALANFGATYLWLGRYGPAVDHFQEAYYLFRAGGDRLGQARALSNCGTIESRRGCYRRAAIRFDQALTLVRLVGHEIGEARLLCNLGVAQTRLGQYEAAATHLRLSLAMHRRLHDRAGAAGALNDLGVLRIRLGQHAAARSLLVAALTLYQQIGDRNGEASALDHLGILGTRLGRLAEAQEQLERSLAITREIGDRDSEAWAHNGLGEVAHTAGRHAEALTHHGAALTLAVAVDDRDQQARAHAGLGRAHLALADPRTAREQYRRALHLYRELEMPDALAIFTEAADLGVGDG